MYARKLQGYPSLRRTKITEFQQNQTIAKTSMIQNFFNIRKLLPGFYAHSTSRVFMLTFLIIENVTKRCRRCYKIYKSQSQSSRRSRKTRVLNPSPHYFILVLCFLQIGRCIFHREKMKMKLQNFSRR